MLKGKNEGGQTVSKRHVKPAGILHTKVVFFSVFFFGASVTLIRPDRKGERSENLSVGRGVDLYHNFWPTCWTQTFTFQMYNYVLGKGFHTKATTILKKGSGRKEEKTKTHVLAEV